MAPPAWSRRRLAAKFGGLPRLVTLLHPCIYGGIHHLPLGGVGGLLLFVLTQKYRIKKEISWVVFCKQLVIPWWYSEWSWSGFRDSVICTNLIILQSWHPSGLVSSVPRPGELFVPMLLLRQGGCALTHNYDGEYCVSKTYWQTKEKYVQQIKKNIITSLLLVQDFPINVCTDDLQDMLMCCCSVTRVSGWHFLWPLTGLAGWDGYDRSWICRQMGGRDPITTSQTLHNTWENVNKIK